MVSPARPLWSEVEFMCSSTSIATAPVPACLVLSNSGWVQRMLAAPGGTTTGSPITVTVSINNGADIANGALTIPTGSNARNGTVVELPVGIGTSAVFCQEGDCVVFTPSGGTGASVPGSFGLVLRST
jgi:hypothetical protein